MAVQVAQGRANGSSWEDFRDIIRTLYLIEDNSLEEVQDKMATRYGFTAT